MKNIKMFFAPLCTVLAICCFISGCGLKASEPIKQTVSENDIKWSQTKNSVLLENDRISFQLDASTSHFAVRDKLMGVEYLSVPKGCEELDETYSSLSSEIAVKFYESTSGTTNYIYSGINSVDYGAFKIETADDAVRVTYTLRFTEQAVLAPVVLTEERFEELLDNMEASHQRKMRLYYKKYSPEKKTEKYKEYLKQYDYLENNALYIFKTNATELDKIEVSKYVLGAGYSDSRYVEDLEQIGVENEDIDLPLSYVIPVEYRLEPDGFTAEICTDLMQIGNPRYKINEIILLPWFSTAQKSSGGFAVLPDGSGAVVNFDCDDDSVYSNRFFGSDPSKDSEVSPKLIQNSCMNMVAANFGTGSFMAVAESCAAQGSYNLKRRGKGNYQDSVYMSFEVYNSDETPIRREKSLFLVSDLAVSENPSVRYILLGKMLPWEIGTAYKNYLINDGILAKKKTSEYPIYLEFIGYTTVPASFLGIPYEKKVTLSTLKDITDYVERLNAQGIKNIVIRLKNFGFGGEKHKIQNKFSLYSGVGTADELVALSELLNGLGGKLYLENDCSVIYRDTLFDGFYTFKNTARQLDNTIATKHSLNLVTGEKDSDELSGYYVAPAYYKTVATDFAGSALEKLGGKNFGISLGFAGKTLISDFSDTHISDRCTTVGYIKNTMSAVNDIVLGVMTDVGNMYTLGLADHVLNMPISSSLLNIQSYSLPVYQMAVRSYIDYAGNAININADPIREYLRSAAVGSSLYYSFITCTDALLEMDAGQKAYPGGCNEYYDTLVKQYSQMSSLNKLVSGAEIIEYRPLSENIFITAYDNGVNVITNFSDKVFQYKGQTVDAYRFICVEGEIN